MVSGFDVYPNPASADRLNFSCFDCSPKGSRVEIFTTDGKKLQVNDALISGDPIDISSLSKGVYLIKVKDSKIDSKVIKFIRE